MAWQVIEAHQNFRYLTGSTSLAILVVYFSKAIKYLFNSFVCSILQLLRFGDGAALY